MFVVTEDWYFVSHRLPLAVAAHERGYDVSVATRVREAGRRIQDAGLSLFPVEFNRGGLNPVEDMVTLLRLLRLYKEHEPDIVHHVALKPIIYGSLAARLAGVKGVVNAVGGLGYVFSSTGKRARLLRALAEPLLKVALRSKNGRLIVQNGDDRDYVVGKGLADPASIRLIRGAGIDLDLYRQATMESTTPLVILPGRLLREKGVVEFVEAARLLHECGVKARFALVGQPDPANPASVSQNEVDDWVRRGYVEAWGWQQDMPTVFAQTQIVCLPSYHEGLPKTLLEAAASSCAIVTTDIPGCRDIVQHGRNGWTVPVRDVPALVSALREAIQNVELRRQYGAAARIKVAREFSSELIVGQTLDVYRELGTPL